MAAFIGEWKLAESDHFDDFLKEQNVPEEMRKKIHEAGKTARVTISANGNAYHVKHQSIRVVEYDFEIGKEHTEEWMGRKVTFVTKKESDTKLIHSGKTDKGDLLVTREVAGDTMSVSMALSGVSAKPVMKFKRV